MWIIIVVVGLIFGLFAFSQIVYPLVVSWPRAKKLKKENRLKRAVPVLHFIVPPFVWVALLLGSVVFVQKYLIDYLKLYYLVLGFIFVIVVIQIPLKNRDLEADMQDSFKPYLKDSE